MMTDAQIRYMVDRFLGWRIPDDFNPDAGISFERFYNAGTRYEGRHEPIGTNLLSADQAEAMVRYVIAGMPDSSTESDLA